MDIGKHYDLSIIIPTKNRQKYCYEVVKQVLNNTSDAVEVIIQDNSETMLLKQMLWDVKEDRLVYHYEKKTLSFVDNFSAAVEHAHGFYLCMIGDDDGVLPCIEFMVKHAVDHKLDALIPGVNLVFFWPSDKSIVRHGEKGLLILSYAKSTFRTVDVRKRVKVLFQNGCLDYQSLDMPRLYHGLVKRSVIESVKKHGGCYFGGLTPDMYMTVALSLVCNRVEAVDYPVTISGICPQSGSAASATGAHTGELSQAPHFIGHDHYEWDERVPAIYSVETIWAETALHTLADFHEFEIASHFNQTALLAKLWVKYPQFRERLVSHVKKMNISQTVVVASAYANRALFQFRRVIRRMSRKPGDVIKEYDIADIHAASTSAIEMLGNNTI